MRTVALASVVVAACAPLPRHVPGSTNVGGTQPAAAAVTQSSTAVSRKQVAGKESPSTLVAQDQTRCAVPATKYRDAAVGDNVWCDWRSDSRAP